MTLRDLIYFDAQKAASFFSQMDRGLLDQTETDNETRQLLQNKRNYDLKVLKANFGGDETTTSRSAEVRKLHHDLLTRLEESLEEAGHLVDLSPADPSDDIDALRQRLQRSGFVRATAHSSFDDYDGFRSFAENYKELHRFIVRCSLQQVSGNKEVATIMNNLAAAETAIAKADKPTAALFKALHAARDALDLFADRRLNVGRIDHWLLEGLLLVEKYFFHHPFLFHQTPFESNRAFRLVGPLKASGLLEEDLGTLRLTYGTSPNLPLTVLALVTSCPAPQSAPPPADEDDADFGTDIEKAFRGLFLAITGIRDMAFTVSHPAIGIHPVAIYRTLTPAGKLQKRAK